MAKFRPAGTMTGKSGMVQSGGKHGIVTAGAPKNAVAFVTSATALRKRGITFRQVWNDAGSYDRKNPVSVLRYLLRKTLPRSNRGILFWTLFSRRLDFVVIMCASSVYKTPRRLALVHRIARLRGAQVILLFVNCGYNIGNLAELVSARPGGPRRVALARRLVARPDVVPAAISPQACRDVEDHFGVRDVRNIGFAPGIAPADLTGELPEDPPMFINIGNYSHRKGQDLFLDVAFRCLERNPALRFCWVGKHVPRPEDVPEIARRGLAGNFIFTKTKSPPFDLIRRSSGLIFTSRSEAFGLVVSESMAMQRTVFCFEGTGGSYQVGDLGNVFARFDTAAMADAVLAHAARPAAERVDLAAQDRYRAHFSPEAFAERFSALLATVSGQAGASEKNALHHDGVKTG
ncbi:glycosyltransferase involved in cell wall biosynthesis [Rhodovulum adriaticum]|uniref:Glycosyltransferase involved in cell wall biosynthesis n=2 Tax=Rhodovulum adriaticum TaxID=35804 RepID=A0A4R2NYE2_RHOAD|nr:glycosyltransferase involved in cell wall biosynthesis [Rhodovulum adriaticum]